MAIFIRMAIILLCGREIASPLQGSSLQDSQVRNDKRRPYGARFAICHYEKGISLTKQSFLTSQEIASPLQGSSLQDSQVRNDKRRPYGARLVICHCEEGVSPTKQSFFAWQSFFCVAGRLPRPCRARNDKYRYCRNDKRRHCRARMTICHCEEGVSLTKQSFLTCQEIASPLRVSHGNLSFRGGRQPDVAIFIRMAIFSSFIRRLLRPCRAPNDKQRPCGDLQQQIGEIV